MIYLIATLFAAGVFAQQLNEWPVIGIWTQPSTDTHEDCGGSCKYLAASYVKWIESAGAEVVPIPYNPTASQIEYLFPRINGFVFPGGGADLSAGAKTMLQMALDANDKGDHFPVWGTCLGFQWLMMGIAESSDVLVGGFDSENISMPLEFTSTASSARLFDSPLKETLLNVLANEAVTMNNHQAGITPKTLAATPKLASFFNVISTNHDRQGVEFVSTVEAFDYPIYGVQWHPEKTIYEWGRENEAPYEAIPHSVDAIEVTQYMASFFVQEARHNYHSFGSDKDLQDMVIYNYKPSYTQPKFVEEYFFHWN